MVRDRRGYCRGPDSQRRSYLINIKSEWVGTVVGCAANPLLYRTPHMASKIERSCRF